MKLTLDIPDDAAQAGRTHGGNRVEVWVIPPFDMTAERFLEIATEKDAAVSSPISVNGRPGLFARWMEAGVKVELGCVVDHYGIWPTAWPRKGDKA